MSYVVSFDNPSFEIHYTKLAPAKSRANGSEVVDLRYLASSCSLVPASASFYYTRFWPTLLNTPPMCTSATPGWVVPFDYYQSRQLGVECAVVLSAFSHCRLLACGFYLQYRYQHWQTIPADRSRKNVCMRK